MKNSLGMKESVEKGGSEKEPCTVVLFPSERGLRESISQAGPQGHRIPQSVFLPQHA